MRENADKPAQADSELTADDGCKGWQNKGLGESPSLWKLAMLWPHAFGAKKEAEAR